MDFVGLCKGIGTFMHIHTCMLMYMIKSMGTPSYVKEHVGFQLLPSSGAYLLNLVRFQKLNVCVHICLNINRVFNLSV